MADQYESAVMLSLVLKVQIAEEVNAGQFLAYKVHKARNIPYTTVVKYAKKVRNGLALHKSAGRPRI